MTDTSSPSGNSETKKSPAKIRLPAAPILVATARGAIWVSEDGEIEQLNQNQLNKQLSNGAMPYVCHTKATARRLDIRPFPGYDVLELFAFIRPAQFCLPTIKGLAQALDLPIPSNHEDEALLLPRIAGSLLQEFSSSTKLHNEAVLSIAQTMIENGWSWSETVEPLLPKQPDKKPSARLKIWSHLAEWEEGAPEPPPENWPVEPVEARARLAQLLGRKSEKRAPQADYTSVVAQAFAPCNAQGEPQLVIAEAGTGIGKTLGYIAPASVWAEKNKGSVWISTYTRNLQRQLDGELDRLHPFPAEKAARVVVRKGRENYLCLLNFEEAVNRIPTNNGASAIPLALMARWVLASRDGDMVGGDFPAWLSDLMGRRATLDLTDTRGECTYSACAHYKKCFIEHTQRRARRADIVVANHALVMAHAALGGSENGADGSLPTRFVFDEGHHLFDAADSAFAAHLSGFETTDLRRWLIGAEAGSRSRSRGLKARIGDLMAGDNDCEAALDHVMRAARSLPPSGWLQRIASGNPQGETEKFLAKVRQQVYARDKDGHDAYSLETDTTTPIDGLLDAANELEIALQRLSRPLGDLIRGLFAILDRDADTLDSGTRSRIEASCRTIERRGLMPLKAWIAMLRALHEDIPDAFADWFNVDRRGGQDMDIGLHRHWIDPMEPFSAMVLEPAHGVLITSATLRDEGDASDSSDDAGWDSAKARTGASQLQSPAITQYFPSPFDYKSNTKILIINDLNKNDPVQISSAYRTLFQASNGGGLGLFTAINRLRTVHRHISQDLDESGIELLAQHVDPIDTGTLVDIFRSEENSCLFGTDAVRDGVDVPGRSLRLIVFDRVPWPRPNILHRARRNHFGGKIYDEMLARLKLKQAYGRLIRRSTDKGIFVMLDKAMPSRLLNAFPPGVDVHRVGLAEAVNITRDFLREEED